MKKTIKFSLVFILLFSFLFGTENIEASQLKGELTKESNPQNSSVEPNGTGDLQYLLSEMVKEQAINACGQVAFLSDSPVASVSGTPIDSPTNAIENSSTDDSPAPLAVSGFYDQYSTSTSGSKIIMSVGNVVTGYGYCHIFYRHMKYAEGYVYEKVEIDATQFKFAINPLTAMGVVMEVINGTTNKVPEGSGKYSKTAYSSTAGTRVKVVFAPGSPQYSAYDWKIITMFPY